MAPPSATPSDVFCCLLCPVPLRLPLRSPAAVVAGGIILAVLVGYVASAAFLGLNSNFIMNPAVAMMLQIFPTAGENFGEILGGICQALSIYAILPMIGGVLGFYLSDFTSKLSGEE